MSTRRIFPGPAGLIRDNEGCSSNIEDVHSAGESIENLHWFQTDAWTDMCEIMDYFSNFMDKTSEKPFHQVTSIQWLRQRAETDVKFTKAAFLVGVLSSVPLKKSSSKADSYSTQCVELRDKTGSIQIAINPAFTATFGDHIQPGTAIAIEEVGLLRLKTNLLLMMSTSNVIVLTGLKSLPTSESTGLMTMSNYKTLVLCFRDKRTCFRHIQNVFQQK